MTFTLPIQSTRKLNEMRQNRHNLKALFDSILVNILIIVNFAIDFFALRNEKKSKIIPFFLRSRQRDIETYFITSSVCGCQCWSERECLTCKLRSLSQYEFIFYFWFSFSVYMSDVLVVVQNFEYVGQPTPTHLSLGKCKLFLCVCMVCVQVDGWLLVDVLVVMFAHILWSMEPNMKPNCHLLSYGIAFCFGVL